MERIKIFQFLTILFFGFGALAQTANLRYEGRLQGPTITAGAMAGQSFTVNIRRADGCGGNLITPWSSSSVTLTDGAFTLKPTFPDSAFAEIMNPNNNFGGACTTPNSDRIMRISWGSETFDVAINDSPKAAFANVAGTAKNATAIGNTNVQPTMSCASGNVLRYNNSTTQFECAALAATDIPNLSASQVPNLAGDVTGLLTSASVEKIRGQNISATAPTSGQVLKFNGTAWTPSADDTGGAATDASYTAKGVVQINANQTTSGLYIAGGVLSLPNVIAASTTSNTGGQIPILAYDDKGRITSVSHTALDLSSRLPLAGGTMSGTLNMNGQGITNAAYTQSLVLDTNAMSAPSPSNAGSGRIYFDATSNKYKVSQNGGAYTDLVSAGGATTIDGLTDGRADWSNLNLLIGQGVDSYPLSGAQYLIGIGRSALQANTSGNKNIAIGHLTMSANTTGYENVVVGESSLSSTSASNNNSVLGAYALQVFNGTGNSSNVAVGHMAGYAINSGSQNTFVGKSSALSLTTGSNNTFLGYNAGNSQTSGSNNIAIGSSTSLPNPTASFQLNIGNTIYGDLTGKNIAINATTPTSVLDINGALTVRGIAAPTNAPTGQGRIYYDSGDNKLKFSTNGGGYQEFAVAGAGISSFNGQTSSSQNLATGTSGAAPAWSSSGGTHTLNIPSASASGVTAGTISKTEYDFFNTKMTVGSAAANQLIAMNGTGTAANAFSCSVGMTISFDAVGNPTCVTLPNSVSGDITGSLGATVVSAIKGRTVSGATPTTGQVYTWSGSQWTPTTVPLDGGNSTGGGMILGTNDTNGLFLKTNNATRLQINSAGQVGVGMTPSGSYPLEVAGNIRTSGAVCIGTKCSYYWPNTSTSTASNVADISNGDFHISTASCTTLNITNAPNGSKFTVVYTNSTYCSNFQLDSTNVTVKWKGGTAPSGTTGYYKYEFVRISATVLLGEWGFYN